MDLAIEAAVMAGGLFWAARACLRQMQYRATCAARLRRTVAQA